MKKILIRMKDEVANKNMTITFEDFEKIDIRVGKVIEAEDFPEARNPAFKLTIDFGPEVGVKRSSVQACLVCQLL